MNQQACGSINPNQSPIGQNTTIQDLQKDSPKLRVVSIIEAVIVHKQKILFIVYFIFMLLLTLISFLNNFCQELDYIKLVSINSVMWFLYIMLSFIYYKNIVVGKATWKALLVSIMIIGCNITIIELFLLLYNYSTSTQLYEDFIYKTSEISKSSLLSCNQEDFSIETIFQQIQANPLIYIFIAQANKDLPQILGMQKQSVHINFLINAYYFIRQILWQSNQNYLIAISIICMIYLMMIDASNVIQIPQLDQNSNTLNLQNNNLIINDSQMQKYVICDITRIHGDQTNLNISHNQSRPNGLFLNNHISEIDKWTDQNQKQFTMEKQATNFEHHMENNILNMLPHGIGLITSENELLYTNESINTIFSTNEQNLINLVQSIPVHIPQTTNNNNNRQKRQFEYSMSRMLSLKEDKSPSNNNRLLQNENKLKKTSSIRNVEEQVININISKSEQIGDSSYRGRSTSKQQISSSENNKIKSIFYNQNINVESRDKNHSILTTKSPVVNGFSSKNIVSTNQFPFSIEINNISKKQRAQIVKSKNIQEIMQVLVMEDEEDQSSSNVENEQKVSQQQILFDCSKELNEQNGEVTDSFIYQSRNKISNDFISQTPIDKNNSRHTITSKTYEIKSPIQNKRSSFTVQSSYQRNNQPNRYYFTQENIKPTKKEVNILCIDKENQQLIEVRLMKCQISISKSFVQNTKGENTHQMEEQKTNCVLIMCEEISEKVYMNKAMRLATYKSKMLASISHELRTPLNCSIGMLQMIYDNDKVKKDVLDNYITPALYSNRLLLNIINDILDYNQINAGNFKLNFTQVSIRKLIEDCLMLVKYSCQMKNLNLQLNSEEAIDNNLQINSDPQRITQILLNLLNNAIKFTEEGGKITVTLSLIEKGLVQIDISDTGCGIPLKKLRNLFNNFGKVNRNDTADAVVNDGAFGAGLGLTISNKLAKGVGNKRPIKVVTQLYKGSTFTFFVENMKSRTMLYKKNTLKTFFSQHSLQTYYDPSNNQKNNIITKSHKTETILSPLYQISDDLSEVKRSDVTSESQLKSIRILDKKDFSFYRSSNGLNEGMVNNILLRSVGNKNDDRTYNNRSRSKTSLYNDNAQQLSESFSNLILNNDDTSIDNQNIFKSLKPKEIEQLEKIDALFKEKIVQFAKNQLCPHCPQILIVDDNEFNILTLKCLLNQYELKTDIALNGKQAFDKVFSRLQLNDNNRFSQLQKIVQMGKSMKTKEELESPTQTTVSRSKKCKCMNYQLIFMDIDMPVMNGFQSTQRILDLYDSQYPLIKKPFISTCSAFVTDQDKDKAKESGMKFFLEKPIAKKKLEYLLTCLFLTQQTP